MTPAGILFKAKPGGAVSKELLSDPNLPPWMHIQCQGNGSYRSSDMCVLLQTTLPAVVNDDDSAVICLDWYVGHRTLEIASLIENSGRVLLMHGGGTAGYQQVNDTLGPEAGLVQQHGVDGHVCPEGL